MKTIKKYKSFNIKEISERDKKNNPLLTSIYYIYTKDNNYDIEWECDSYQECIDWIDSY